MYEKLPSISIKSTSNRLSIFNNQRNEISWSLVVVIIVVVVGGNEKFVLLQEIGYVLADRGADQQPEYHTADDTQEAERRSLRLG